MIYDPGMTTTITVPEGAAPGFKMKCTAPDGAEVQLTLPMGIAPGSVINLKKDPATGLWTMADPGPATYAQPMGSITSVPTMATAAMPTVTIGAMPGFAEAASFNPPRVESFAAAPAPVVQTSYTAPPVIAQQPVVTQAYQAYGAYQAPAVMTAQPVVQTAYTAPAAAYSAPPANVMMERRPSWTPPVIIDQGVSALPTVPVMAQPTMLPAVATPMQAPTFVETVAQPTVTAFNTVPAAAPYAPPAVGTVVRTPSYTPPPAAVIVENRPSYTPPVVVGVPSAAPVMPAMAQPMQYAAPGFANPGFAPMQAVQQVMPGQVAYQVPVGTAANAAAVGAFPTVPTQMVVGAVPTMPAMQMDPRMAQAQGWPMAQGPPGPGPWGPGPGKGGWEGPPGGDWYGDRGKGDWGDKGKGKGGKGDWGDDWQSCPPSGMYANKGGDMKGGSKGGYGGKGDWDRQNSFKGDVANEPWMDVNGQWHEGKGGRR